MVNKDIHQKAPGSQLSHMGGSTWEWKDTTVLENSHIINPAKEGIL